MVDFLPVFKRVRSHGLGLTLHIAEVSLSAHTALQGLIITVLDHVTWRCP